MAWKLFNLRLPDDVLALVLEAVAISGEKKSVWAREALEDGARREIAAAQRTRVEAQREGRAFVVGSGLCRHPGDRLIETSSGLYCTGCQRRVIT